MSPSSDPNPKSDRARRKRSSLAIIRARVLAGFVLIVPFGVTILVARFLYDRISTFASPIVRRLLDLPGVPPEEGIGVYFVPVIGIVLTILVTFLMLYTVGFISNLFVTRRLTTVGERLLLRIPLLKDVYGLTKQVLDMMTSKNRLAFKQVALIEYPSPGAYVMAFVAGESRLDKDPDTLYVHALMPFAPLPTQLILMVVPASKAFVMEMSMEEAMKFLMSGGAVSPEVIKTTPYRAYAEWALDSPEVDDEEI